jgi:hypothetical protein
MNTKATISVPVGKTSDNLLHEPDMASLPHLFLSYSHEQQLLRYFSEIIRCLPEKRNVTLAAALSKNIYGVLQPALSSHLIKSLYIRNETTQEHPITRYAFLQQLNKELKRRQRRSLAEPLLLVLVEDVLDLVITRRRSTGLQFLQLLIEGPACGMHVIAASGRAYRNLLLQLLNLNPVVKEQLQKQMPGIDFSVHYPLGAELVMTPEDVYFFRNRNKLEYTRFFPL